jgi:predicted transcriptional regulator
MAKDAKTRAKARALYEAGHSFSQIADELPVSDRAMKEWCRKEGWKKGISSQELHQKEREKLVKEAEAAGVDRARILKELAILGFSDIRNYLTIDPEVGTIRAKGFDDMGADASRAIRKVKERRTIKQAADGKETILESTFEFDLHDKLGSLVEMGNILGIKKVELDPGEGFRTFFQSLKGSE